ncbi:hypothetical protein [Lacisediminimonas profundi]|uniref:hypothetical protein n=1 Tax=Lacisediminimonas profundi TaxID=2603856 RepID=UPI00124B0716|nr:hypothetical protein [Lacisediminimonas profundi]
MRFSANYFLPAGGWHFKVALPEHAAGFGAAKIRFDFSVISHHDARKDTRTYKAKLARPSS